MPIGIKTCRHCGAEIKWSLVRRQWVSRDGFEVPCPGQPWHDPERKLRRY